MTFRLNAEATELILCND